MPKRSQKSAAPSVVSLFTGAGGLDLGLEAAGFQTRVAVEMDGFACETLAENRPEWPLLDSPIEAVTSRAILRAASLRKREADLVVGGPPCQPFSKSAFWNSGTTARLEDPRANTIVEFVRVIRDCLPKAFLLENVRGFLYRGKDEGLKFLEDQIVRINSESKCSYKLSCAVVNAAHFGVPQLRERTFIIASRDGRSFEFPTQRFGDVKSAENEEQRSLLPFRTAWDALGDLPASDSDEDLSLGGYWGDLLPSIPEGKNYLHHTDRGGGKSIFGWRTRYWNFLLKLSKQKPSWTVQASPGPTTGPFHWANRQLSRQELLRLQTFPDGYEIVGPRREAQRQIGNAVPSLLAEVLGWEIRRQLLDSEITASPLRLLTPARPGVTKPERLRPVPRKYLRHVGDHSEHPGEGQGPGANRSSARL